MVLVSRRRWHCAPAGTLAATIGELFGWVGWAMGAISAGLVEAARIPHNGVAVVRVWQANIGKTIIAHVPVAFLGIFFVWPVVTLVGRGFWVDGALDLSGFVEVFSQPRTWRIVGLTLAQGVLGTVVSVLLGVPGAYVLYRCSFRGQGVVRALVTVPFVLPTVVVGVAFRALLSESGPLGWLGWDGTFTAIIAALVFFNYSVVVRTVGGLWEHLDPR